MFCNSTSILIQFTRCSELHATILSSGTAFVDSTSESSLKDNYVQCNVLQMFENNSGDPPRGS
jgi:hypothetical protein